jgi:hypothetical protein
VADLVDILHVQAVQGGVAVLPQVVKELHLLPKDIIFFTLRKYLLEKQM